jgi:threonine dehydratase
MRPAGETVTAAAARLAGAVIHTPLTLSETLSDITGARVWVKFENLQFTASYKERGALNRLLAVPSGGGVVTASAGNFAQGVAYHARRLGLDATIVMPLGTPMTKVARTRRLGARVVLSGRGFDEASEHAGELATELDHELLSPFDDAAVIAGQGTVALEMLDALPTLEVLVVPVGGGGLLAGSVLAAAERARPVEVVGVQSERYPAVHNAVTGDQLPVGGATIAEGIAVAVPGRLPLEIVAAGGVASVEVVREASIEQAIGLYLEVEKTVAEGAGAVALAELLERPARYQGRTVGLILSGGNIDLRQLALVTIRMLMASGRLTPLEVELDDLPGRLGEVARVIGEAGANIVDVVHERLDLARRLRSAAVTFTVETIDEDHLHEVIEALEDAGFSARRS